MTNDEYMPVLEATHDAVEDFARVEYPVLTRKVIYRLQRFPASGTYGDDFSYKTLWDEYCHEIQEGPHPALQSAWDHTLDSFMDDVIEGIPRHVAVLLSIFAAWDLEELYDPENIVAVNPDYIKRVLRNQLSKLAGMRNLDRFESW